MISHSVSEDDAAMELVTQLQVACLFKNDFFREIDLFSVIVPKEYDSIKAWLQFRQTYPNQFANWIDPPDSHHEQTSTILTPGRRLKVKALAVKYGKRVSWQECLCITHQASWEIFMGVYGLVLAYQHGKEVMARTGKRFVSFSKDDENRLYKTPKDHHVVPAMTVCKDGNSRWSQLPLRREGCYGDAFLVIQPDDD